jgi:hypothetical protein
MSVRGAAFIGIGSTLRARDSPAPAAAPSEATPG